MKESTEMQRQQLVAPVIEAVIISPVEGDCTTRNTCGSENSNIGGSEDILF
ncbi:hypothetical protein SIO70_11835 [Chitinophaga sancti]|uniref:hypothetical protein n=1 Tax=Chitinophaga sancti TaxID=1004 RepID=UPI002A765AE4|nr:hypothetical protein [Chitinophaga sancti]WPQ65539.1 hypothetical protein SIO70_11835 [Chitinophaga sancti]